MAKQTRDPKTARLMAMGHGMHNLFVIHTAHLSNDSDVHMLGLVFIKIGLLVLISHVA
jgi:hypothetical protein